MSLKLRKHRDKYVQLYGIEKEGQIVCQIQELPNFIVIYPFHDSKTAVYVINESGNGPTKGGLDPANPPRGGSGVPKT